jgi:hypothetical protein
MYCTDSVTQNNDDAYYCRKSGAPPLEIPKIDQELEKYCYQEYTRGNKQFFPLFGINYYHNRTLDNLHHTLNNHILFLRHHINLNRNIHHNIRIPNTHTTIKITDY